ncbi:transposable element Tcb2 transposase [Trichonephila clavipes]|uniref:Transposable element Tcb2 transposase n=1 Tax=Trichonephila clavipes TaxID=2585209 RepID=A0A8X6S666_TRICX|nr:transposable element Tcb2 transposase [Trichonephila clavipes]
MNPIEHVWDALGRQVAGRQPHPQILQELARAILEEWDRIPQLVINSTIDSMPQSRAGQGQGQLRRLHVAPRPTYRIASRRHSPPPPLALESLPQLCRHQSEIRLFPRLLPSIH